MKHYVIKRILSAIPLLICISFVCFCFINLIPSDPAEVALRVRQVPVITEEAVQEVRSELGLDKPFFVRYVDWVVNCVQGDFGISYTNPSRTVSEELLRCMPATLELAGASFILVILLSIPIGFFCAVYKDSLFDKVMRAFIFMTTAMPAYWIGLLLMWFVSIKLDLLPTSGNNSLKHLILPALTVSLTYISTYIRLIRNNMLENMKKRLCIICKCKRFISTFNFDKTYFAKFYADLFCGYWYEYSSTYCWNNCCRKCICLAWIRNIMYRIYFQS